MTPAKPISKSNYKHKDVESKWQKRWDEEKLYVPDIKSTEKPKYYNLWMFPYPSAEGLHAGHAFASTGSDIYGRFMRMQGRDVLQPIGYDSFGIHSENYAIKIGETPQTMLARTTKHYEDQLRSLGHGYDWTRTVTTSDVEYYSGTQWLFLQMFKQGLAYKKKASVNFCPSCKTVLADEQVMSPVAAGKEPKDASGEVVEDKSLWDELKVCERCGTVVEKKELMQWFLRITDYAERLLGGLESIDWSERVKIAQKEWIGKKEGVTVSHQVIGMDIKLEAFSAYPAWLFADTFLVIAPNHPIVADLVRGTKYEKDVLGFVESFKSKGAGKNRKQEEKEGIFTGREVMDPITGRKFPVWLANFALMEFGTGVIRCSAHDPRDYEFAQKYKISLEEVVKRTDEGGPVNAHQNKGTLLNSGKFSGREIDQKLIEDVVSWIGEQGFGNKKTSYHLRDWLVSRQRYWGAPIPMIYCQKCATEGKSYITKAKDKIRHQDQSDWDVSGWWPEENLPVTLPEMKKYVPEGTGHGPLDHHPEFYKVKCPECGSEAKRETDVMDTFVDSSWYFLKYPSVAVETRNVPWDPEISKRWLPVDLYFGGAEHSVLHLMYARFVNMVMHDLGVVEDGEPFPRFFAHGLMIKDGAKMSKSRGNVVNPDEYVNKFGADTLRLYLMFMGPMDGYPDFRDTGIEGMQKFVNRIWRIYKDYENSSLVVENDSKAISSKLHQTIKRVTENIEDFKYNTAIAALMELTNTVTKEEKVTESFLKDFCLMLAPFAPHLAEEIWVEVLKNKFSVHVHAWPEYDKNLIRMDTTTIVVQVNGKVRAQLDIETGKISQKEQIIDNAMKDDRVSKYLEGKNIKNTIFVPGRLVNLVTSEQK
jgi:leucyl-tRNA synthetase